MLAGTHVRVEGVGGGADGQLLRPDRLGCRERERERRERRREMSEEERVPAYEIIHTASDGKTSSAFSVFQSHNLDIYLYSQIIYYNN